MLGNMSPSPEPNIWREQDGFPPFSVGAVALLPLLFNRRMDMHLYEIGDKELHLQPAKSKRHMIIEDARISSVKESIPRVFAVGHVIGVEP